MKTISYTILISFGLFFIPLGRIFAVFFRQICVFVSKIKCLRNYRLLLKKCVNNCYKSHFDCWVLKFEITLYKIKWECKDTEIEVNICFKNDPHLAVHNKQIYEAI